jgi:hypothetical protein
MKYRFEIEYHTKESREITKFLKCCDLNIEDLTKKSVVTFESRKDVTTERLKDCLIDAYESIDCDVLKIEGGKVE